MNIRYIFLISTVSISVILLLTGCRSKHILNASDSNINELVPKTEVTLESKREDATNMCSFLKSSYEKMQELAAADNAAPDGIKAAKAVEEDYADRLNELFALDFTAMDEDEIDSCLVEMTDLITAVREARDALTLH